MELPPLSLDAFEELCETRAKQLSEAISENEVEKVDIKTRRPVLNQCFVRAETASQLFMMDGGLNYFKEAGLHCYWIRKLKPFHLERKEERFQILPINEILSLYVGVDVVLAGQDEALKQVSSDENGLNVKESTRNQIRLRNMEQNLVSSLRYFVFSPGSMPLLFEALLRIPLDDRFAFDLEQNE